MSSNDVEEAIYDEETGEALNDAARRIVERATQDQAAPTAGAGGQCVLDAIPAVELAPGKWKYVAITLSAIGKSKRVVRSIANLQWHGQVFEATMEKLRPQGVEGQVIGGGRIEFYPEKKTVSIYGYSKTFGRKPGCNKKSCEQVREAFPDLKVDWSDSGY